MAVRLEHTIKRYIGLSGDQKPVPGAMLDGVLVDASAIPAGSSFLESDTGHIYRWTGSEWMFPTLGDGIHEALAPVHARLALIEAKLDAICS